MASSITPELITRGIAEIALNPKSAASARLKGFELLGRIKAMFIDRIEQKSTILEKTADLSDISTAQLLASLQARLRLSSSGVQQTAKPSQNDTLSNKGCYVNGVMAEESVSPAISETAAVAQYSVDSMPASNASGVSDALIAINTGKDTDGGRGGVPGSEGGGGGG